MLRYIIWLLWSTGRNDHHLVNARANDARASCDDALAHSFKRTFHALQPELSNSSATLSSSAITATTAKSTSSVAASGTLLAVDETCETLVVSANDKREYMSSARLSDSIALVTAETLGFARRVSACTLTPYSGAVLAVLIVLVCVLVTMGPPCLLFVLSLDLFEAGPKPYIDGADHKTGTISKKELIGAELRGGDSEASQDTDDRVTCIEGRQYDSPSSPEARSRRSSSLADSTLSPASPLFAEAAEVRSGDAAQLSSVASDMDASIGSKEVPSEVDLNPAFLLGTALVLSPRDANECNPISD